MTRRFRLILMFLVAAGLVGGLVWTAVRPVPVPADLALATRGPMEVTVDVDGVTRIREVYEVSAPISGTAERSPVRVGDPVAAGDIVAVVEPIAPSLLDARSRSQAEAAVREAEAAVDVARSQLVQAEEDLTFSEQTFNRTKELVDRGVSSLVALESATQQMAVKEAARNTAQSSLTMAEGTLERARAALIGPELTPADSGECCVRIAAPATGVVLSIDQISARPVAAGQRLLSIGDPTDLEIVADPLSRDATRIPAAARAHVERWGGDAVLSATLRRIEPSARTEVSSLGIEEQRVEAVFDLDDPPEARPGLSDGYAVRLRIVIWSAEDTLTVPLGALFRQSGAWAVFAYDGEKAVLTPVEVGQRNDRVAEVLAGLEEGTQVIAHPSDQVADGVLIAPAERE